MAFPFFHVNFRMSPNCVYSGCLSASGTVLRLSFVCQEQALNRMITQQLRAWGSTVSGAVTGTGAVTTGHWLLLQQRSG